MPVSHDRSAVQRPAPAGSISAAALAARYGGGAPETIHRSIDDTTDSNASAGGISTGAPEAVQRWGSATPSTTARSSRRSDGPAIGENRSSITGVGQRMEGPEAEAWFTEQLERNMDLINRRLEERMIIEFERRGGRMWGGL